VRSSVDEEIGDGDLTSISVTGRDGFGDGRDGTDGQAGTAIGQETSTNSCFGEGVSGAPYGKVCSSKTTLQDLMI
jgi:hypothetical protein